MIGLLAWMVVYIGLSLLTHWLFPDFDPEWWEVLGAVLIWGTANRVQELFE